MTFYELLKTYDISKRSKIIALDMIFLVGKIKLNEFNVDLHSPRVLDLTSDRINTPNTSLLGDVYRPSNIYMGGRNTFLTKRIDLDNITKRSNENILLIPDKYPYKASELVEKINAHYNVNLSKEDLIDFEYDGLDEDVLLVAHPNSIAWTGFTSVRVRTENVPGIFDNVFLDGFNAWDEIENEGDIDYYNGDSLDKFIALLNKENGTDFVLGEHFTVGEPRPSNSYSGYNTVIHITSLDPSNYSDVDIFYNRLDLSVLDELPEGYLRSVEVESIPTSTYQILNTINDSLNLRLKEDEIVNLLYSQLSTSFELRANSNSLMWVPASSYNFTVALKQVILTEVGDPLLTEDGFFFVLESFDG